MPTPSLFCVAQAKFRRQYWLSTSSQMTTSADLLSARFVLLRLAVGFLGQSDQGNWWGTSFLSQTGLAFVAYNFARAPILAAYTATIAAAKILHDERIGRAKTVHLFRLTLEDELRIHAAASHDGGALLQSEKLKRDHFMDLLESCAAEIIDAPVGPIQIGTVDEAFSERGIQEIAKHYLAAFQRGSECFPYFAVGRK